MIAKVGSQLGSPTLAATTRLRLRRWVPLYMACVMLLLFVVNLNLFRSPPEQPQPQHSLNVFVRPPLMPAPMAKTRADFPRKIWQTWKVDALSFEERDYNSAKTWLERNPDYRYEVLTDNNALPYVEYHFGPEGFNRPDIVTFFREVQAAIVKADLLRYLVMYAEGGVYADIDVEAIKPVWKFVPERYEAKDIDMVIGIEIDEPDWKDHPILGPKSRSFCQWTFMCKPQLPVMMRLIEQIMDWLNGVAEKQGVSLSEVELDFDEIISGTGPSAFTQAILADMNSHHDDWEVSWDHFHDMSESRLIDRVLVLTVEAFAAGQGHSDSGNHDARSALVKHHYHASNWPSRHPRYSHPIYGEVEKCNWNDECVHKWDENVAAFKAMSEEDQQRMIEEKKRKEEEEERRREEEERRAREEDERRAREEEEAKRRKEEEARKKEDAKRKEEEERRNKEKEESKQQESKQASKQETKQESS